MKKRLHTLAIIATAFVCKSCLIETYERPYSNSVGYEITECATSQLLSLAITSDQARVIDLWYNAASMEEKNQIEDTYFPSNKIRQTAEDTIVVTEYIKVFTNGKSLTDGAWKILPFSSRYSSNISYTVQQLDENLYQIESIDADGYDKINQTTQIVEKTNEYIIKSKIEKSLRVPFYYYDYVSINTTQPVKLTPPSSANFTWWEVPYCTTGGEVNINAYKDATNPINDQTSAQFDTDGAIITFRNHKEIYQKLYLEFTPLL